MNRPRPGARGHSLLVSGLVASATVTLAMLTAGPAPVRATVVAAPNSPPSVAVNANLPATTLTIRGHRMVVEIASTPVEREIGLMNRFSLQPDHGMLFVFDSAQPLAFWMKNTFIPLSVAYVGANGRILNIEAMAPQDLSTHWSQGAALYAIEMRQGWFFDHGIGPGDTVQGLGRGATPG